MTDRQKKALLAVASDLSRGDAGVIAKVEAALANPPRTTEEVGYYVTEKNTPFENCFRKLVSLLAETPYAMSVEDKYVYEILALWTAPGRLDQLPAAFRDMFPDWFGVEPEAEDEDAAEETRQKLTANFVAGVSAVEKAFEATGEPLLSFDTGSSDTMVFIQATPEAADRWRNVKLGESHDGEPLAVRSPMWNVLWGNISYSADLDLGDPPDDLPSPPLRELS